MVKHNTTLPVPLQLHYVTLHPAAVGDVTNASTPKSTAPTTSRSISGFSLPSMHHKNAPIVSYLFLSLKLPPPPCAVLLEVWYGLDEGKVFCWGTYATLGHHQTSSLCFLRAVKRNQRSMFLRVSLGSPSFQPNFEVKKNLHSIYIVVSGFL